MKFFANMFEGWFRSKFYSKCKSNINLTMMRIEIIKRRRKAMQKFLRNDIADLLRNGLDSNAYSRVGGLYLEQNRSICYEYIEQFCTLISDHLTAMNNESECPEECREAVPSLMYAAARFADLPELRVLRSLFSERYGNSLEAFINKEFVDLLKQDRPTKGMKVELMQEIAQEYGIEWDSKALEQKLYELPSSDQDWSQTDDEKGCKSNIQETENKNSTNHTEIENKQESNTEIEKQIDDLRGRILNYWLRTTSLLSNSREPSTSPEESSSDDSPKGRSFFKRRFKSPRYVKTESTKKGPNSNTSPSSNNSNVEICEDGTPTRVESRSTECSPGATQMEARNGHAWATSYQQDSSNMRPPTGHVHPKLPDYDDIIAKFAALRSKS